MSYEAIWLSSKFATTIHTDNSKVHSFLKATLHSYRSSGSRGEESSMRAKDKASKWCRNVGRSKALLGRIRSCLLSKRGSPAYGCWGKCPHCWAGGPWLQGSVGPPVARFGETTGWRSANTAVNSSSQSPWLPAGVYLKIPDVKITEHFVGRMSTSSRCQSSGKLMYSDQVADRHWMEKSTLLPHRCVSLYTWSLVIRLYSSRICS